MATSASKDLRQYSIWDNFELHKRELVELGASEDEIESLRVAAEAVAAAMTATSEAKPDLVAITEAHTCANGWVIQPPTKQARFYARLAALEATGGQNPTSDLGAALAVMAGLWALRLAGESNLKLVLAALASTGGVAGIVADMTQEGGGSIDQLAEDYMLLMGFRVPQASGATATLEKYLKQRLEIIDRLVGASPKGS